MPYRAVSVLEVLESCTQRAQQVSTFLQAPTRSGLLEGRWRLLYTSRPGTASPIQQTFVGVDAFTVYQEILSTQSGIRINNIVSFGPTIGQLKVRPPQRRNYSAIPC